jgi:hypothetical protein
VRLAVGVQHILVQLAVRQVEPGGALVVQIGESALSGFKGEARAGGVVFGRHRTAHQAAQVNEVLLGGGTLFQRGVTLLGDEFLGGEGGWHSVGSLTCNSSAGYLLKPYSILTNALVISAKVMASSLRMLGVWVLPCPANGVTFLLSYTARM